MVLENRHGSVGLDADRFEEVFDDVRARRFGQTQTEYKKWAVERLEDYHSTSVTDTGDNSVTYNETREPNRSEVSGRSIDQVSHPVVRQTTTLQEDTYP